MTHFKYTYKYKIWKIKLDFVWATVWRHVFTKKKKSFHCHIPQFPWHWGGPSWALSCQNSLTIPSKFQSGCLRFFNFSFWYLAHIFMSLKCNYPTRQGFYYYLCVCVYMCVCMSDILPFSFCHKNIWITTTWMTLNMNV